MIKKSFYIMTAVVAMLFASCEKYDHAISDIEDRLDKIEGTSLTSIDQQIAAINGSIDDLKEVDAQLDGYIKSLQTTAADLQSQLDATNEKIDNVKKEMGDEIDALEQNLLNELNKLKTDIEGQLATINNAIVALQAKDDELDQKIANLQTYVDNELANYATTDWATATFATLQMYQETQEAIAGIELNIKNINDELKALETRINEKIANDIKAAVDALRTELGDAYKAAIETAVEDVTSDYKAAIQTARNEIEAAYKAAIETAVATLKTEMQNWVNEQLEKPLEEIAALQAALKALTNEVATDEELAAAVAAQEKALEEAVVNLTAAYEAAIKKAIEDNNGVINTAISNAITTATNNLNTEINNIKSEITSIKSRLDELENNFAKRIQSLTFVPQYSDGKILMDYSIIEARAHFRISPAEIAEVITTDNVKAFARYTDDPTTRASYKPEFPLTIRSVSGDNTGMLEVKITESSENQLSNNFWLGKVDAIIYIQITDKNGNNVVSDAIPMIAHNYAGNTNSIGGYNDGGDYTGDAIGL